LSSILLVRSFVGSRVAILLAQGRQFIQVCFECKVWFEVFAFRVIPPNRHMLLTDFAHCSQMRLQGLVSHRRMMQSFVGARLLITLAADSAHF
jgi:uncharacterized membrane protein